MEVRLEFDVHLIYYQRTLLPTMVMVTDHGPQLTYVITTANDSYSFLPFLH